MGEYWQVCNLTKREAYDTRGNYKTCGTMTYEMRGALLWLIGTGRWSDEDDIRLLSDYGGERLLNKETWEATEAHGPGTTDGQCRDMVDIHFAVEGPRAASPNRFEEEKPPAPRVSAKDIKVSIGGVELKPMTQVRYGCDDEPEPNE